MYFNDAQQQTTKDAGQIAGLDVLHVINEPTATALAYSLDHADSSVIAIYDLSGGTFNISMLEMQKGVFKVKSTNDDTHLGGKDFNIVLIDHILNDFKDSGLDLSKDHMSIQCICEGVEKANIKLLLTPNTEINLPSLLLIPQVPSILTQSSYIHKFETLIAPLVQCTIKPCKKALSGAGIKALEIDEVILVGDM